MYAVIMATVTFLILSCSATSQLGHNNKSPQNKDSELERKTEIFIESSPPFAEVYMDSKLVGKTNFLPILVEPGTHTMRFVREQYTKEVVMEFSTGINNPKSVDLK